MRHPLLTVFLLGSVGCSASDHVVGTRMDAGSLDSGGAGAGGKTRNDPDSSTAQGGSSSGGRSAGGRSAGGGSSGGGSSGGTRGDASPTTPIDPTQVPTPDPNAVVIPNLDSAVIKIDLVAGARDYRAFVVEDGVEVLSDAEGRETVNGGTIFCAGLRQHAAPKPPEPEVVRQIEVTGLEEKKTFVVEAIDTVCPFTGLFGRTETTLGVGQEDDPELHYDLPIVTETAIRSKYGSLIVNGQGASAKLGLPAAPIAPKVLERWSVEAAPLDAAASKQRKTRDFFSDFSSDDQPRWVEGGTNGDGTFHAPENYGYSLAVYQNSEFAFYSSNSEVAGKNHVFLDRGQLHTLLPDLGQGVMSTTMAVPKKATHVNDDSYLHVTFESKANSTARRYWWLSLCGPETAGQTFDTNGLLKEWIILLSGFFGADGRNPSVAGWNCLIVFPHDGIMTPVPTSGKSNPENSLMVIIHKANAPAQQTAVDVSPQQLNDGYPRAWYRMQKAGAVTERAVLDDALDRAPRRRFDLYVSRKRLYVFVDGEQRICNDFGPERLTMAEGAVGFNTALYHSSAEHDELTVPFADRSGQLYLLENTLYADMHTWDNVGFEEGVGLPSSSTDADCYTHAP